MAARKIGGTCRPVLPGATEVIAGHLASKTDWTDRAINCGVVWGAPSWARSGGQTLAAVGQFFLDDDVQHDGQVGREIGADFGIGGRGDDAGDDAAENVQVLDGRRFGVGL